MTFKNILFPVDFSDCSRALNPEVEYLAQSFNSNVTLLHVFEIPFTWYGSGEAPLMNAECLHQYIESEKLRLNEYPICIPPSKLRRVIAEGDAAGQIMSCVAGDNIDLVMMGTHGYGTIRRLLLGSIAMKVLHDLACPVWTHSPEKVSEAGRFTRLKNIVCALELNDEAAPLLRFVSDLANEFGASVRILHSVPDYRSQPHQYFDKDLHRFLVNLADEQISKMQQKAGTCFDVDLVDNPIGQATAIMAAQQRADLVVIGRGKSKSMFGSVRTHAYDIIRQSHCPVLSYCVAEQEALSVGAATSVSDHEPVTAM